VLPALQIRLEVLERVVVGVKRQPGIGMLDHIGLSPAATMVANFSND